MTSPRWGGRGYPKLVTKGDLGGRREDANSDITTKKNCVQVFIFHLFLVSVATDESEAENVEVEDALVIPDRPCLIPCMEVFLMDMFETTYE